MSSERTNRVRAALAGENVDAALLSSIPSVAQAAGHWPRWEMWPGQSPHTLDPTLCCTWPDREPLLLLPGYYASYARSAHVEVRIVPSYDYLAPVDKLEQLTTAIAESLGDRVDRVGHEPATLSAVVRDAVSERVRVGEWVDVTSSLERVRIVKTEEEIAAIRRAAGVADLIQSTVKERAEPGRREVDLAAEALTAAWSHIGHRFPILIQLKGGPVTAERGQWHPGRRELELGDVVCTDTAPWLDGVFADSCNGVAVGEPDTRHREAFALAAAALHAGLDTVRPGARAADVDRACRDVVRGAGFEYPHHTGHGVGYARAELPRITPTSPDVLEEGMVVALEPGVYVEGWGGFRHEHLLVVRSDGPEMLTCFQHTL